MDRPDDRRAVAVGAAEAERRTVAFIVPLFDEAAVLPRLIEEIEAYRAEHPEVHQVVLVDDGSRDDTAALARRLTVDRPGYLLLQFSRNFGHQLAITAGMHFVDADAAVVMDADLQDPLWVVTEMIERWHEGYDVVYGVREERAGETWFKRATAFVFYRFFRRMTDLDAPLDAGDFRLVSRAVIEAFRRLNEQQPFVRGLVAWLGFNQTGISYKRAPRKEGGTKYPFRRMWRLATDAVTSFSNKPLRYAVGLGMTTAVGSVVGLGWIVLDKYALQRTVPGWASLIFAAFFFGGLQLLFLGIVGAYLARVYEEVKGRPRYILRDVWHSEADVEAGAPAAWD